MLEGVKLRQQDTGPVRAALGLRWLHGARLVHELQCCSRVYVCKAPQQDRIGQLLQKVWMTCPDDSSDFRSQGVSCAHVHSVTSTAGCRHIMAVCIQVWAWCAVWSRMH